jgi:hypothetical protein
MGQVLFYFNVRDAAGNGISTGGAAMQGPSNPMPVYAVATSLVDGSVHPSNVDPVSPRTGVIGIDSSGIGQYMFQFPLDSMLTIGDYTMRIYLNTGTFFSETVFRVVASPSSFSTFFDVESGLVLPATGKTYSQGKPVGLIIEIRDSLGDRLLESGLCTGFSVRVEGRPNTIQPNPPLITAGAALGTCVAAFTPLIAGDSLQIALRLDGTLLTPRARFAAVGTVYSSNPFTALVATTLANDALYFTVAPLSRNTYVAGTAVSFTISQVSRTVACWCGVLSTVE